MMPVGNGPLSGLPGVNGLGAHHGYGMGMGMMAGGGYGMNGMMPRSVAGQNNMQVHGTGAPVPGNLSPGGTGATIGLGNQPVVGGNGGHCPTGAYCPPGTACGKEQFQAPPAKKRLI